MAAKLWLSGGIQLPSRQGPTTSDAKEGECEQASFGWFNVTLGLKAKYYISYRNTPMVSECHNEATSQFNHYLLFLGSLYRSPGRTRLLAAHNQSPSHFSDIEICTHKQNPEYLCGWTKQTKQENACCTSLYYYLGEFLWHDRISGRSTFVDKSQ